MWFVNLFLALVAAVLNWFNPRGRVTVLEGDTLPGRIAKNDFILLKDDGEDWSVGFQCPCGCGDVIELLLLPDVEPRWDIEIDEKHRPTLRPSIWRTTGCCSHFWVEKGQIAWVP
jgi:hypothetical protein